MLLLLAGIVLGWLAYKHPWHVLDGAVLARLRLAGIRGKFTRVGKHRVHYLVGGRGRPLLLVHGLGARAQDWTPQLPAYVREGFRVYAIDLLGCGNTDRPDIAYTIQQQVDLLRGFLDSVDIERADIAGWSMGGWIALRFALDHPNRVRRLVAMSSAGLSFPTTLTPGIFEPQTITDVKRLIELLTPDPPHLPSFLYRAILRAMSGNREVIHRSVQSMMKGQDSLDGKLGELRMPVLLIWGARDALIPSGVGERMHREIPGSELEIYPDCGHLAPVSCANHIVRRVVEFLQRGDPYRA